MKRVRSIGAALMSLMCCSCTSVPVHYYTLLPPIPASSDFVSAACCKVQIRRVLIPPEVDRPELVARSGEDQVIVLSNATWLAPIRDEIQGALTTQINLKLPGEIIIEPGAKLLEPVVLVNVTRFEAVPAQYVLVAANWRIQQANVPKIALLTCEATARITVTNGISAIVQGYQQAITMIADQIAVDLLSVERNAGPRCGNN